MLAGSDLSQAASELGDLLKHALKAKAIARLTFSATHSRTVANVAPTGRKVSFGTIDIWRVECGKLAEHWDLVDTAGLQKQLRGE